MKRCLASIFLIAVLACGTSPAAGEGQPHGTHGFPRPQFWEVPKMNSANLKRISVGMSKEAALETMGRQGKIQTYSGKKPSDQVSNPHREERFEMEGSSWEIFYYNTAIIRQDGEITDEELTPLVFRDDVVAGIGWPMRNTLTKE